MLFPASIRVAKRVHIWIKPVLFRLLSIDRHGTYHDDKALEVLSVVRTAMQTDEGRALVCPSVRHLCLGLPTTDMSAYEAYVLVAQLPNLENLLATASFITPALLEALSQSGARLRRLAGPISRIFDPQGSTVSPLSLPCVSCLTHLDIFDSVGEFTFVQELSALASLTHLGISGSVAPLVGEILSTCPSLHVLLIQYSSLRNPLDPIERFTDDDRVIATHFVNYWAEWKLAARTCRDVWDAAEEFITAKRVGTISSDVFIMNTISTQTLFGNF
ncbi:unnamed protein product [Mycena citricolor]|uniref:Uncharacterized protein n=1 Tax=Mycena citricolor TaxID=2018698 RepID=A0AAD2HP28_9AGAR|nr:unnamed protein product [Mycena citricolor]